MKSLFKKKEVEVRAPLELTVADVCKQFTTGLERIREQQNEKLEVANRQLEEAQARKNNAESQLSQADVAINNITALFTTEPTTDEVHES